MDRKFTQLSRGRESNPKKLADSKGEAHRAIQEAKGKLPPDETYICLLGYLNTHRKPPPGREWRLKPVIPTLWEAKVGGSRGQELNTSLTNMVKHCLY